MLFRPSRPSILHRIGSGSDLPRKTTLCQPTLDHSCQRNGRFQKQVGELSGVMLQFLANPYQLHSFCFKKSSVAMYIIPKKICSLY